MSITTLLNAGIIIDNRFPPTNVADFFVRLSLIRLDYNEIVKPEFLDPFSELVSSDDKLFDTWHLTPKIASLDQDNIFQFILSELAKYFSELSLSFLTFSITYYIVNCQHDIKTLSRNVSHLLYSDLETLISIFDIIREYLRRCRLDLRKLEIHYTK